MSQPADDGSTGPEAPEESHPHVPDLDAGAHPSADAHPSTGAHPSVDAHPATGAHPSAEAMDPPRRARWFIVGLALIGLVALGVRVGYIVVAKSDGDACGQEVCGDAYYYSLQAEVLAQGNGFERPFTGGAAADHPPLTALVVTPAALAEGENVFAQRLTMALVGTGAVLMIGLLGRAVAGDRTGLIAAALAALYPNLWMNDGVVMSEALTALGMATCLWLTYRLMRAPGVATAAWLGAALGLSVLARAELALYAPLVVVPVVLWRLDLERRAKLIALLTAGAATLAVLAPWTLYNATRFERPVLVSTNDGLTLIGANCDGVFSGAGIGLWDGSCAEAVPAEGDQSEASATYRRAAIDYMADHLDEVPAVVAARVGRVWGVYRPGQMADYSIGEGRERTLSLIGTCVYYPLVIAAVAGAVVLVRRRTPLWPLAATFVMVTITAMALYGLTRFRVPAEVAIVVLAAVLLDRVLPGGGARTPAHRAVPDHPAAPQLPEAAEADRNARFAATVPPEAR